MIEFIVAAASSIVLALGTFFAGPQPEPNLGAFGDPFLSIQLAGSPANGECLKTDGTNNDWDTCGGGGGAFPSLIATTSDIGLSQLAYFSKTSGTTTLASVATGTVSAGTGISVTSGRSVIGGALTITNTVGFPYTPDTNYAALTNATSTPVWFQAGLQASSTSQFNQASTSLLTVSSLTTTRVPFSTTGGMLRDDADLTFDTDTLYVPEVSGPVSAGYFQINSPTSGGSSIYLDDTTMAFDQDTGVYHFYNGDDGPFIKGVLNFASIATSDKTYSFQNKSGTVAHLDDIYAFPFIPTVYGTQNVNSTSTGIWFKGAPLSVIASSTFSTYASTTQLSIGSDFITDINGTGLSLSSAGVLSNAIAFPFTPNAATVFYGQVSNSTTTHIHFGAYPNSLSASSTSYFDLINVGSTTASTQATSTFFNNLRIAQNASTSKFFADGLATCNTENMLTWANGTFGCESDSTTAGANPFAWSSNFAAIMAATTSPLWARATPVSLAASSTSWFDQINVGSSTIVSPTGTSTFYGDVAIRTASTTKLIVSNSPSALLLTATNGIVSGYTGATCTAGNALTALSALGAGTCTPFAPFPFTPTTSFGSVANSTSTLLLLTAGLSASSTVRFGTAASNSQFVWDGTNNKLGIGSTTPWGLLSVNGNVLAAGVPQFVVGSSTKTNFIVTANHAVGIGTTSPFALFSINPFLINSIPILAIGSSSQTHLLMTNNGHIGIGTSSPFARFTLDNSGFPNGFSSSTAIVVTQRNIATTTNKIIDCKESNTLVFPIGTSATTITLKEMVGGQQCKVVIMNPSGTAGTITWAVSGNQQLYWAGGTAPTQTTTANKRDVYSFLAIELPPLSSSTVKVLINGAQTANF